MRNSHKISLTIIIMQQPMDIDNEFVDSVVERLLKFPLEHQNQMIQDIVEKIAIQRSLDISKLKAEAEKLETHQNRLLKWKESSITM